MVNQKIKRTKNLSKNQLKKMLIQKMLNVNMSSNIINNKTKK